MIVVNGIADAMLPADDRGLSYGDGIFRTLLMRNGRVANWQRHYAKLVSDCAFLGIDCPAIDLFEQDLAKIGKIETACVVKMMVTRGVGQRGYGLFNAASPTRIMLTSALPQVSPDYLTTGVRVRICNLRLAHQPRLAGVKHLNRLEQVLARSEWQDVDIAEGLLLDQDEHVIGGTMSNLFMVRNQHLYTPDLSACGIAGVTRDRIQQLGGALGLVVKTAQLSLADLFAADEVMLCNSLIGVWQVREVDHKQWSRGIFTPSLRALLELDDD